MGKVGTPMVGTPTEQTTSSTSCVLNYPPGLNGVPANLYYMVMLITTGGNGLISVPSGWSQITKHSSTGDTLGPSLMMCGKFCIGSENGTLTVGTANVLSSGQMLAFPNVNLAQPFDVAVSEKDQSASLNNTPLPTMTLVTPGCAIVYGGAFNSTTATSTPPTSPQTFTETYDHVAANARSGSMGYLLRDAAGATGTVAIGWSATARSIGAMVALRPGEFLGWGVEL